MKMIEWKKFDKTNHPMLDKEYLVYDGKGIDVQWLYNDGIEVKFDTDAVGIHWNVTHYADINLPEDTP
jgi:hypothetical protein